MLKTQYVCLHEITSPDHHDLDLALKSPNIIVKEGLNCLIWFRGLSELYKNSNLVIDWLGDQYVTITWPFWFWRVILETMHCAIKELSIIFKDNFF